MLVLPLAIKCTIHRLLAGRWHCLRKWRMRIRQYWRQRSTASLKTARALCLDVTCCDQSQLVLRLDDRLFTLMIHKYS